LLNLVVQISFVQSANFFKVSTFFDKFLQMDPLTFKNINL